MASTRRAARVLLPLLCAALLLTGRLAATPATAGVDGDLQLPDLVPLPTEGIRVGVADDGVTPALRFNTVTANRGEWALEIQGQDVDQANNRSVAAQCVRWTDPRTCAATQPVGELTLDVDHNHTHFDEYALLQLRRLLPDGTPDMSPEGLASPEQKASFCLLDTVPDRRPVDPAFENRFYGGCGPRLDVTYGISPGWRDIYDGTLEGQQILIDAVPDGDYALVVTIDPEELLLESDETNNTTVTTIRLKDDGRAVDHLRRFAGRLETGDPGSIAADLCQHTHPSLGGADHIVLARDDVFADALAGAPLAGPDGCVLYTTGGPGQPLDPIAAAEIDRAIRTGDTVFLLGGVEAVSAEVEAALLSSGYDVRRLAGPTRYDTAAAIADVVRARNPARTTTLLANAGTYADAITGGAYAAWAGLPVLLTDADVMPAPTAFALEQLGTNRTIVLGGTAAVSAAVADATPSPRRIAGPNRMATAVAVAEQLWGDEAFLVEEVILGNLERADGWTATLAAAPLAARLEVPILGLRVDAVPAETRGFMDGLPDGVDTLDVLGDVAAVSPAAATAALDLIR